MMDAPEFNKNIQNESREAAAFKRFSDVIKCLRAEGGCPWDLKQTPLSMRTDLVEETFEALDAISAEDAAHAKEELGDILLNALMISYMYEQNHDFTIEEEINEVADKIIRRHPHVFNASEGAECMTGKVTNAEEVLNQWDKIKAKVEGRKGEKSILDEVPEGFPPLLKAYKMQKKAAKHGFDWESVAPVKDKVLEELEEVQQAFDAVQKEKVCGQDLKAHTTNSTPELDKAQLALEEEAGDLLFAVVNYSRHLGIDPTVALSRSNQKFYRRFSFVEQEMKKLGHEMNQEHFKEMDSFWDKAKEAEKESGKA